jgi:sugar-specific transcriptional regulator TrmB
MRMDDQPKLIAGLQAFGLDKKEAKIYLASLRLGPASVLDIARQTKLPRTTIYPILEKLEARGVFRAGKIKKKTVYTAVEPTELERRLKERMEAFAQVAPDLEVIKDLFSGAPTMTFYEGTEGFKRMWKRIYRSGVKEYYMMTSAVGYLEYVREPYLLKKIIADRLKLKIKSHQLVPENRETRKIAQRDAQEFRETRFIPKSVKLPAAIIIFGDEVAFITTRRENAMIIVASGDVAVTLKTMFELIWQCAKRPESPVEWGAGGA